MTANTSKGYTYPLDTDPLSDVAEWIMTLASQINDKAANSAGGRTQVTTTGALGTTLGPFNITFPAGRFSATPAVVATAENANVVGIWAIPVSSNSFNLYLKMGTANATFFVNWIARTVG